MFIEGENVKFAIELEKFKTANDFGAKCRNNLFLLYIILKKRQFFTH
jgi:hypothetical protein